MTSGNEKGRRFFGWSKPTKRHPKICDLFFARLMFFSRKAPIQKRHRRRKAVAIRVCSSSNHVSCSESAIKIYGSKEEIRLQKSPETVDAPGFSPDASIPVILYGRSVIIGFQKTQIYQRFAGSRQEVFILKIQNDENNAAQQDNGRRFHIEIKQKQGQYFLLFLFDSIELLLHHSLQKHPRLLLQRYSDRSV